MGTYSPYKEGTLVKHKTTGKLAQVTRESITIITHGEYHGYNGIDDTEVAGGIEVTWLGEGKSQGKTQRYKNSQVRRLLEIIKD
tara:strand:- start:548 stop:799 length:252 start_codon:yes stop_codon:yes gene_type:complete